MFYLGKGRGVHGTKVAVLLLCVCFIWRQEGGVHGDKVAVLCVFYLEKGRGVHGDRVAVGWWPKGAAAAS